MIARFIFNFLSGVDNTAFEIRLAGLMKRKNPVAVALGKMRKGVKEKPSDGKRTAAIANLKRARAKWAKMKPEDRARK